MYTTIAVISDIHSNTFALEAILQEIDLHNVDLIVNLGDSLFGPIDPLGTAQMLMKRKDIVNIMGNCDEILLEDSSESLTYRHVKPLLRAAEENWISEHKDIWRYDNLLFCHGTPWDNSKYLMEKVASDGVFYKTAEQLTEELRDIDEQFVFCGHTHVFYSMDLPDGKRVVNPGSVGLPAFEEEEPYPHVMESGTPYASYCLCRRNDEENGWSVEHRLVKYDWDRAAAIAEGNGRQDYAAAIRTGRV